MSAASASPFPGRQHGGIRSAVTRAASYQEPATRETHTVTLARTDTQSPPAVGAWSWAWPQDLGSLPPDLPPPPGATMSSPVATVVESLPSLAGAVVFLGPSADPTACTALTTSGATVVEVPADPSTAHGAEIIGAAAAIARTMPTTS